MRHDILADAFCTIKNKEGIGRADCLIPDSKLVKGVMKVAQDHKYIGKVEHQADGKGGKLRVGLIGKINDCNVIKPRFSVERGEFSKFEKRFLPADNIGILIVSTSKGVMDQREAKKLGVGGKLLGYIY